MSVSAVRVAIVDYGVGNIYSIQNACARVGLDPIVTSRKADIARARAIFLPGVGAFGDAMGALRARNLVTAIQSAGGAGIPIIGICLGQQLLMDQSEEFGGHQGLGLISGKVVRFESPQSDRGILKVPQVGWNRILIPSGENCDFWSQTPLERLPQDPYQYFVHSYYVMPSSRKYILAETVYGNIRFPSSIKNSNIIGFQFHPERSGMVGLQIYQNLAYWIGAIT